MPGRLCACFILTMALWLNMLSVNDATASSIVHRHKHHNHNNHRQQHSSQHGNSNHQAATNNNNNNNNSHNSVSHHMQSTHYGRHKTSHHAALLHQNQTIAMHSITLTQNNNRTVNNGSTTITLAAAEAGVQRANVSTSTQRSTRTATAAAIKSQKLSLINAQPVYNRIGGNIFNAVPSNQWPVMLATDNTRRIVTTKWHINFNPIATTTTASPNGIVRRVLFNDQRIFTKPHMQRG